MADASEAMAALCFPHGIRRSLLFAYARRLSLDDERLVRLAEAGDGLRAPDDPTYHALRWPDSDPAAGMDALVREAESLQPYYAVMFRPRPPTRPHSRKRRPRRRIRFHALDGQPITLVQRRTEDVVLEPDYITARGTPYVIPTRWEPGDDGAPA